MIDKLLFILICLISPIVQAVKEGNFKQKPKNIFLYYSVD
jgi:hypothetical protein